MIRKAIPAAPITNHLPGDVWDRRGMKMRQYRAGILIATHALVSVEELIAPQFVGSGPVTSFFIGENMPGIIATMTEVHLNITTGGLRVRFASGNEREWPSVDDAKSDVAYLDTDPKTAEDLLLAKTFFNSPDNTNLENMIGGSCSIDRAAAVPVVLTEPE